MRNLSTKNIQVIVLLVSVFCFAVSQLAINSVLSPMGLELQSLNSEKNYLVEENRSMEEQIAKSNSIIVIQKLAAKELKISSNNSKSIVYIENTNIIAELSIMFDFICTIPYSFNNKFNTIQINIYI